MRSVSIERFLQGTAVGLDHPGSGAFLANSRGVSRYPWMLANSAGRNALQSEADRFVAFLLVRRFGSEAEFEALLSVADLSEGCCHHTVGLSNRYNTHQRFSMPS